MFVGGTLQIILLSYLIVQGAGCHVYQMEYCNIDLCSSPELDFDDIIIIIMQSDMYSIELSIVIDALVA